MPHFRCYLLNAADTIVSVDSVEAEEDALAMFLARQLIAGRHSEFAAIEVWDHARCVGKIANETSKHDLESLLKIPDRNHPSN
jgi:hypothetical protein